MNIIKFKDKIKDGNEWFNSNLKGKYAYWIQMHYAVPFDVCTQEQYVAYEKDIDTLLSGDQYIDTTLQEWSEYIDNTETELINSISKYLLYNSYTTDDDITIDELKVFRRWLAQALLSFTEVTYDANTTHMLQYYANDMYDDTVKWLNEFGTYTVSTSTTVGKGCGCQTDANLSSLYNTQVSTCDPLTIYRKNIWSLMVSTFSVTDFWTQFAPSFLQEFKLYIDNILKVGLPLSSTEWTSVFADCTCGQSPDSSNRAILSNLSLSLDYMIKGEVEGHKNFIAKTLNDWSSVLYEKMFWV